MVSKLSLITRESTAVISIEGYPTAISDGAALDLNSSVSPGKYRQQKRWREVSKATLDILIKQVEGNSLLMLNQWAIAQKYIDYFEARYPDCQFWASEDRHWVIAVKQNGILVGLVMPLAP